MKHPLFALVMCTTFGLLILTACSSLAQDHASPAQPVPGQAGSGTYLWFSDFHFEPFYYFHNDGTPNTRGRTYIISQYAQEPG